MQENEFEKQVKQKMDGLRLRPSEPVWLHVNNELRKKRRRRLIFIPLFAVLLFGGYIMWQSIFPENKISATRKNNSIKNKLNEHTTTATTNENDKLNNPSPKTEKAIPDAVIPGKNKNDLSVKKENVPVRQDKHLATIKENGKKNYVIADKNKIAKEIVEDHAILVNNRNTNNYFNKRKKKDRLTINDNTNTGNAAIVNNMPTGPDNNKINTVGNVSLVNDKGHSDKDPVLIANNLQREISVDSIASNRLTGIQLPSMKSDRFNTSNSLKVGFVFAAGVSSRTDKPLQVGSSREKTISALPGYNLGSPTGSISGGVLILPPSDVKPGVAFKAGVMAMKPVSNRLDVSAGLLYTYSSDHIQVGKSIASAYSAYYSASLFDIRAQNAAGGVEHTSYTNKYHFIEVPVSVYYNLTGKWKKPLVWNAGVSVSRLISTNALLYDAALGGVYYDGNKDINKTQFNISTGFSFRLTGNNRWQWNIGPEIYISTTKLFNNAYDENKHPLYGGIHVQALFPVKKKHK